MLRIALFVRDRRRVSKKQIEDYFGGVKDDPAQAKIIRQAIEHLVREGFLRECKRPNYYAAGNREGELQEIEASGVHKWHLAEGLSDRDRTLLMNCTPVAIQYRRFLEYGAIAVAERYLRFQKKRLGIG